MRDSTDPIQRVALTEKCSMLVTCIIELAFEKYGCTVFLSVFKSIDFSSIGCLCIDFSCIFLIVPVVYLFISLYEIQENVA